MKYLIPFTFLLLLLASCGDDAQDCNSSSFMTAISDEENQVSQAANAYANDPSQANCDAFKSAAQNYFDAVEEFEDCDGLSQAEFDQALAAARESINLIPC